MKVCKGLSYVFIKFAKAYLQKCITWPKNSRKRKQKLLKTCITIGFKP